MMLIGSLGRGNSTARGGRRGGGLAGRMAGVNKEGMDLLMREMMCTMCTMCTTIVRVQAGIAFHSVVVIGMGV
jgi:hypothetical protein